MTQQRFLQCICWNVCNKCRMYWNILSMYELLKQWHKSHPIVPLMDVCFVFVSQPRVHLTVHYQVHTIKITHACKDTIWLPPGGGANTLTYNCTPNLLKQHDVSAQYFCNKIEQKIKYAVQYICIHIYEWFIHFINHP